MKELSTLHPLQLLFYISHSLHCQLVFWRSSFYWNDWAKLESSICPLTLSLANFRWIEISFKGISCLWLQKAYTGPLGSDLSAVWRTITCCSVSLSGSSNPSLYTKRPPPSQHRIGSGGVSLCPRFFQIAFWGFRKHQRYLCCGPSSVIWPLSWHEFTVCQVCSVGFTRWICLILKTVPRGTLWVNISSWQMRKLRYRERGPSSPPRRHCSGMQTCSLYVELCISVCPACP